MLKKYKTCNSYYGIWEINLYKEENIHEIQHSLIFTIDYTKGSSCSVNINSFEDSDFLYFGNSQKSEKSFSHYKMVMKSHETSLINHEPEVSQDLFMASLALLSLGWGHVFTNLFYNEKHIQLNVSDNRDEFNKITKVPSKSIELLISSGGDILAGIYQVDDTIYKVKNVIQVLKP